MRSYMLLAAVVLAGLICNDVNAGPPRPLLSSTPQLRVTITGNPIFDGVYIADYLPTWSGGVRGVYGWRGVNGNRCIYIYGATQRDDTMSMSVSGTAPLPQGWIGRFQGGLDPGSWDITSGAPGVAGVVNIRSN